jgi:hypothetical protein
MIKKAVSLFKKKRRMSSTLERQRSDKRKHWSVSSVCTTRRYEGTRGHTKIVILTDPTPSGSSTPGWQGWPTYRLSWSSAFVRRRRTRNKMKTAAAIATRTQMALVTANIDEDIWGFTESSSEGSTTSGPAVGLLVLEATPLYVESDSDLGHSCISY